MMFKISPRPTRFARLIFWGRYIFLLVAVSALCYCALVLGDTWSFQACQTRQFKRALKDAQTRPASLPLASREEANRIHSENPAVRVGAGSVLGRIEIKSIGLAAMIMEGIDGKTLRLAVGHIPGTPIPGQWGNVGLAAHRDTFFRGLRNIHKDDEIIVTTLEGPSHYLVDSTQVVGPDDMAVLAATTDNFLTLVSCYPFYFVGPAPKRFIVRAHRISE